MTQPPIPPLPGFTDSVSISIRSTSKSPRTKLDGSVLTIAIAAYMLFVNGICTTCSTLPGLVVNFAGQAFLEQIRSILRLIPFIGGEIANNALNIGVTDFMTSVCYMSTVFLAFLASILLFSRNSSAIMLVMIVCIIRLVFFVLSLLGGNFSAFGVLTALFDGATLFWAFQKRS